MNVFNWNETQLFSFFFVFLRISGILIFLPIFGDKAVPYTVKILFSLALSVVVFPIAWGYGARISPDSMNSTFQIVTIIAADIAFGVLLGFVSHWIFDAVQFGGFVAGTSMGFAMATVFDPSTDSQTIAFAKLKYVMAALIFLTIDGHHMYLSAILHSFKVVPLGEIDFLSNSQSIITYLIRLTAEVFILGVKFAAPIMIVILLVNLSFGIMARAVPQMNVLVVSFTANILFGLFIATICFPGFVNQLTSTFEVYTPELFKFINLFSN